MAVLAGAYAANKVTPPPTLADFNKFDKHATQKFPLGHKVETAGGDVYRYGHFGADTNRGVLVSTDVSETQIADSDNAVLAPASCVNTDDGKIGARFVEITMASVTANQFVGGKFVTTDGTGIGYTYDIKSNTATNNPATGTIRLELHQPLQVALDATTDMAIIGSLYHDLETASTTDACVVGISCSTMDVSEQAFGWIQTKGVCSCLTDAKTLAIGYIVTLSELTAGAIGPLGGDSVSASDYAKNPIVGYVVDTGDSTGHTTIKMNLE